MTIRAILQGRDAPTLSIGPKDLVKHAISALAEKRIGAMPVVENGQVVGIFSERDVVYGIAQDGAELLFRTVADVMISPAITVEPATPVLSALSLMTRRRIRHLPVVENGRMIGFVSIGDLVKFRIDNIEAEANALRDYIQTA